MVRAAIAVDDVATETTINPKEPAMHPSIAHAIASGIQDPDWRLLDPTSGHLYHASPRLQTRRRARPAVTTRLRWLLGGRRLDEDQWLSGVVPPLSGYPAQR